jgi:diaminohydroxyphosphoribosylaminopyrimidine deaminase/5-amino-6-(5-phosphoribosylamino)uracil reductase
MRSECDAIVVGAGTVIADNPRLTARIADGRDPLRVIVDGRLRVPPAARVLRGRSSAGALIATTRANVARARIRYGSSRVEVLGLPGAAAELSMAALMKELGRRGLNRVIIEGGSFTAGSAIRQGVVDRLAIFIAPKILGGGLPAIEGLASRGMRDAVSLSDLAVRTVGADLLIEAAVASAAGRARRR